jgi:hypothetical protein
MKTLNNRQITKLINQFWKEYDWDTKQKDIAIDLAKYFIENTQSEFNKCLDNHKDDFDWDDFTDRLNIRKVALNEIIQYLEQ